jgi:hypothetical protein
VRFEAPTVGAIEKRSKRMVRKGRELERLVASLQAALKSHGNTKIESPKFLKDLRNGQDREFDVVITVTDAQFPLIVALECRDRTAAVDTPEVEQFWAKCQDTLVNKSCIVSSTGFSKPALTKAQDRGITCLTLTEAEKLSWLGTDHFTRRTRRIGRVQVIVADSLRAEDIIGACHKDGSQMDERDNARIANRLLDMVGDTWGDPGQYEKKIQINSDRCGIYLRDTTGAIRQVETFFITIPYEIVDERVPLHLHHYKDEGSGKFVANLASATWKSGETTKRVILAEKPGSPDLIVMLERSRKDKD